MMLRLLLRLWWLQQRRNFSWRNVIIGGYIVFLYVVVGVSFYFGVTESGGELFEDGVPETLGMGLTLGILIPDMIMKMIMKRDSTAMDDYVKSRPLPEKIWNRFLLLANLVSFWNYVLPVLMLPVLFLFMSVPQALVAFLMLLTYSMIDGIFITCYRKTTDWMLKWPLVLGWIGMMFAVLGYMVLFAWMPAWLMNVGMFVLACAIIAGLVVYLYHLKIYNETKRKVSKFRTMQHINFLTMQYIGMMRAKRVRNMVFLMALIFFFDAYMFALLPADEGSEAQGVVYCVGAILFPSIVLSQWTFGIEANFFHGLMTKPVSVRQLLAACYKYYCLVSVVMAVLSTPLLFISDAVTPFTLLGSCGMAVVVNLINLPTCLFSSRLEIFNTSLFSMQGANTKINVFSLALLIPLGLFFGVFYFWGGTVWFVVCMVLGAIGWAVHPWVVGKVASVFEAHKYARMEKYME